MTGTMDEATYTRMIGHSEHAPAPKAKRHQTLFTDAEREEMRQFAAAKAERAANAAYLGWPTKTESPPVTIQVAFAAAFRRKAALKRKEAAEGTSSPENFPDVVITTPAATIALGMAAMFDSLAADIEAIEP